MLAFRLRFVSAALVAAGALVALGQTSAHAQTTIGAGQTVTPAPTIALGSLSAGPQVGTTQVATFDFTNNQAGSNAFGNRISGTIYSATFRSTAVANSVLDFYYQVQLNNTTNTSVAQITVGEFGSFLTQVAQTTGDVDGGTAQFQTGTVASTSTSRTADGSGLLFNFATFTSGNSYTQFVRTNAITSVNGSGSAQGTGVSGTATGNVLVTGTGAPEPGSLALLGTGLLSMGGIVIRRRTAKK